MKKIGLILAGCLAFAGVCPAYADDIGDAARAAVRRDANTVTVSSRQKSNTPTSPETVSRRSSDSVVRGAITGTARTATVVERNSNTNLPMTNVVARTAVIPRATTAPQTKSTRTTNATITRSGTRSPIARTATRAATKVATREDILKRDFAKCKNVFTECMDEFCANKDAQLKRCACSARVNDFDKIKKQLADVDEKMLDFNQRLLTVSMDKEDVAALNIETEGEKAFYNTKDKSESKKTLDEIAKKLNIDFSNNKFSSPIGNVLSWSLDIDSAFDSIDSLHGASTAAKSGTALYAAALPVCREMAAEVCSAEDLKLAENGYSVLIEQSCDTVEKTYRTAAQQARNKVLESSALLDISRLDVYQKKNADDILTCKKKMLSMLTDSTVCGDKLGKCLDITGQYIDPTTGEAFLSTNLSDLASLITRPDATQTWTTVPDNAVFVDFLNSKKKFLEPAMENCQDISGIVWDAFVEDALSQIKIAQIRKLDEVRQSCTTLTAQCLTDASESITNFDARALSTFGVTADLTAKQMCDEVLKSCTALFENVKYLYETDENKAENEWALGTTGIQTDVTYNTIRQTCTQVGRACIIQVCTSMSGNFGLCENIDTSINRKSVLNRTACWNEVKSCVASAGEDAIKAIFERNHLLPSNGADDEYKLYSEIYAGNEFTISNDGNNIDRCIAPDNTTNNCINDICYKECGEKYYSETDNPDNPDNIDCMVCRLAENLWGNCEASPETHLPSSGMHNKIVAPNSPETNTTLLYWFAQNTNTSESNESCRDTTCGIGFTAIPDKTTGIITCENTGNIQDDGETCSSSNIITIVPSEDPVTNCCNTGKKLGDGNCCASGKTNDTGNICPYDNATLVATFTIDNKDYYDVGPYSLYCSGNIKDTNTTQVECDGRFFLVGGQHYINPNYNGDSQPTPYVSEWFKTDSGKNTYKYTHTDQGWKWLSDDATDDKDEFNGTPVHWTISFGGQ